MTDQTITINDLDLNNILVDGNSAGDIFNAVLHNPGIEQPIKAAIAEGVAKLRAEIVLLRQQTQNQSELENMAAHLNRLAALYNARGAVIAAHEQFAPEELKKAMAEHQSLVNQQKLAELQARCVKAVAATTETASREANADG